jgi:hypothetical protein
MSLGTQASVGLSQRAPAVVVMRNLKSCLYWLALFSAASVAFLFFPKLRALAACLGLFSLQAVVADWLGIRISEKGFSAPRRFRLFGPQLVFWRSYGDLFDIESLTSVSGEGGGGIVHLRWMHGTRIRLIFASRARKLEFFQTLRQFRPDIGIYRDEF